MSGRGWGGVGWEDRGGQKGVGGEQQRLKVRVNIEEGEEGCPTEPTGWTSELDACPQQGRVCGVGGAAGGSWGPRAASVGGPGRVAQGGRQPSNRWRRCCCGSLLGPLSPAHKHCANCPPPHTHTQTTGTMPHTHVPGLRAWASIAEMGVRSCMHLAHPQRPLGARRCPPKLACPRAAARRRMIIMHARPAPTPWNV